MRRQRQVLECFWKSDQKSTLIAGCRTRNEQGTSRWSKPVHIGDLHMGLISCLHWLVGAPIKCPPPPPISLRHSVHVHAHAFRIRPHFRIWTCPSVLASHLGGLFHHKPALVASFILWLEYLLCAHHTHSPFVKLPHTPRTPPLAQPPPFLPRWPLPAPPFSP